MNTPNETEDLLRSTLQAVVAEVQPTPDAYRRAHNTWRHRERRRRFVLAIVVAVVFSLSVLAGLLVLNHAAPAQHSIFNTPVQHSTLVPQLGAPGS